MPNWTIDQLKSYTQRRLKDEQRTRTEIYANHNPPQGPCSNEPECFQRRALVGHAPGKKKGIAGNSPRFTIRFIVRSRRPADWDNLAAGIKPIQDLLVKTLGIAPGDEWNILQGHIVSEKAQSKEDEGTTVIIESL